MNNYEEEFRDVIKYANLCDTANDSLSKQVYRDIMHDEYHHARILKHLMQKESTFVSNDNITKLEQEAERVHERFL